MKKAVILAVAFLVLVLAGCVLPGQQQSQDPSFAFGVKEVQDFLQENPDAKINSTFLSQDAVRPMLSTLRATCGQQMDLGPYWYVVFSKGQKKLEVYLDQATQEAKCIILPGQTQGSLPE